MKSQMKPTNEKIVAAVLEVSQALQIETVSAMTLSHHVGVSDTFQLRFTSFALSLLCVSFHSVL